MKIVKELNVSREAYFDLLKRYLLKDLRRTVSRSLKQRDLVEGFKFDKKYQMKNETFISHQTIEKMRYGEAYRLKMTIPKGVQIISHQIEKLDENRIKVTYEEIVDAHGLSLKLKKLFKHRKNKQQMQLILEQMETEIILNAK